jgi:hypothetical protein
MDRLPQAAGGEYKSCRDHNWREVLVGAVSGLMEPNARMLLEDLEGGA